MYHSSAVVRDVVEGKRDDDVGKVVWTGRTSTALVNLS